LAIFGLLGVQMRDMDGDWHSRRSDLTDAIRKISVSHVRTIAGVRSSSYLPIRRFSQTLCSLHQYRLFASRRDLR
jgi:hypothetical protein